MLFLVPRARLLNRVKFTAMQLPAEITMSKELRLWNEGVPNDIGIERQYVSF